MKTLAKCLLAISVLSLCACKGNNQSGNGTDTTNTVVPERFPQPTDTPASQDTMRSDSAAKPADTSKIK